MAKKFLTGLRLVNLNSDPLVGSEGELYFNTSASVAKIYKNGAWSELAAGAGGGSNITVSTTEPVSPETGDAWYKNDTGEFYIYDGTYWVEVNGTISLTQEEVQDYVAPMFTSASGTNVVAVYDDANNVINLNTSGSLISVDSIVYPDYITFDTTPETEPSEIGSIWWNPDFETANLQLDSAVTLQIGQEHLVRVKNSSGLTAIPDMRVVMFAGSTGDTITVTPAIGTDAYDPEMLVGITTEEIDADGFGFVTQFGFVNGVDTTGASSGTGLETWTVGDLLYSDPNNYGYLTNVKPSAPNWKFPIAAVTRVNINSGRLLVRIIPGNHLRDLVNVEIDETPADDQALIYNSSASVWNNAYIVNSVNGTDNQILVDNSGIGDVTFSLSNDLITPGNLTVTGDLTVSGSTTYLNTQTLNIEDNIITLNSNVTGAPFGTSGIEVERGDEINSYILWDESLQAWHFSNDVSTYAVRSENILELNVSASAGSSGEIDLLTDFAELNINTDGSIDLRPGDISGFERYKFTKTHLEFPDLTQQNTAFLGMSSYDTDDLDEGSSNLYFTNERAVDALTSTLANYLTLSNASSTYLTQSDASLTYLTQASASSTYLTTETDPVFVASDAYQITSASTAAWNESYSWGDHSTAGYSLTSHNHSLDSLSNVVITGTPTDGQAIVWDTSTSKWVNETIAAGSSYPDQTGNDGKFLQTNGASVSWQNVDFTGYLTEASASTTYQPIGSYLTSTISDQVSITNTTPSTSTSTGALVISGGLGVGDSVWIEGDLHVAGTTITENTQTVATHDNMIYLNAAYDSTITNAVYASGSITYTADNLYVAGMDIRVTGVDPSGFNISSGDGLTVASATPTEFVVIKSDPGSSYVSGGIAHAKNEANPDLGFAGGYYSGGYAHAGLFRDASDGIFKIFDGYTPEPDEAVNIDTTHPSFSFAPLKADSLDAVDTSTTRTNLGLAIGIDIQAYDSTLAAVAGGTYTGDDSITTLGTIISGTWNGSTIGYAYGGTGLTTLGTAGQVLTVNSGATGIEWATPSGGGGGGLSTTTTSIVTNSATAIESFAIATSRTAEAIIQITQGTDYYSSKVLLIHDDTTVKITEYAILESTVGAIPVTISAAISGSDLELLATITDAATTNATAKVILIEVAV